MDNPVGRLQSELSTLQVEVIVGSVLGDARLECRSTGVRYPTSARVRVQSEWCAKRICILEISGVRELVSERTKKSNGLAWSEKEQRSLFVVLSYKDFDRPEWTSSVVLPRWCQSISERHWAHSYSENARSVVYGWRFVRRKRCNDQHALLFNGRARTGCQNVAW